jgi:dTDP-4-dehydrorhamnose 3,5-epimerase
MNLELSVMSQEIEGVVIKRLLKIPDERGCIFHMLRCDDPDFENFGEIYFSLVYPGVIKGWHRHHKMTLNYAVITGMIKLVIFDDRVNSSTRGRLLEVFLGEHNYSLVKIPPGLWNGFKGIGNESAIVANCATHAHDPEEIERLDPFSSQIPYNWSLKHG